MKVRFTMALVAALMAFTALADEPPVRTRHMVVVKDGQVITNDLPGFEFMVARGFLGVQSIELTPELREHFRLPKDAGVLVSRVVPDSPAAKAGIRVGDVITAVDGNRVDSPLDLARAVRDRKKGESVKIDYSRDGANGTAMATVAERERREVELRDFNVQIPDVGKHLEEYFNSPEWKAKMEHLQDLPDCATMQQRMRQLETKMKDLEKRLNRK